MHIPAAILLLYTVFGILVCVWAGRRWLRQFQGQQQYTLRGAPVPWVVWPLALLTGLSLIAASLLGLLGSPMWVLDHVFAFIKALFG